MTEREKTTMLTPRRRQGEAHAQSIARLLASAVGALVLITACSSATGADDEDPACAVSAIAVSPPSATVVEGDAVFFSATIVPLACSDRAVSWSTSDSAIATVASNGRVVGISEGTAEVRAAIDSLRASAMVIVEPPLPMRPRSRIGTGRFNRN